MRKRSPCSAAAAAAMPVRPVVTPRLAVAASRPVIRAASRSVAAACSATGSRVAASRVASRAAAPPLRPVAWTLLRAVAVTPLRAAVANRRAVRAASQSAAACSATSSRVAASRSAALRPAVAKLPLLAAVVVCKKVEKVDVLEMPVSRRAASRTSLETPTNALGEFLEGVRVGRCGFRAVLKTARPSPAPGAGFP